MNESILKRIEALEKKLGRGKYMLSVVLPDGTKATKCATEWWEHRHEWGLEDFAFQKDPRRAALSCYVLAAMFDEGISTAKDPEEAEYRRSERDVMLRYAERFAED